MPTNSSILKDMALRLQVQEKIVLTSRDYNYKFNLPATQLVSWSNGPQKDGFKRTEMNLSCNMEEYMTRSVI